MKFTILTLLTTTLATGCASSEKANNSQPLVEEVAPAIQVIDLHRHEATGMFYMPVNLNGQDIYVLIDSGAEECAFDTTVAEKIGIELTPNGAVSYGVGGASDNYDGICEVTSEFASFNGTGVREFSHFQSSQARPINGLMDGGVIGHQLMHANGVVIDLIDGELEIGIKGKDPVPEGFTSVDMVSKDAMFLPVIINGTQGIFLVDTGAQGTVLAKEYATEHNMRCVDALAMAIGAGEGGSMLQETVIQDMFIGFGENIIATGDHRVYVTPLGNVLGKVRLPSGEKVPVSGVMGMDLLTQWGVRLDVDDAQFTLRENPPIAELQDLIERPNVLQINAILEALLEEENELAQQVYAEATAEDELSMSEATAFELAYEAIEVFGEEWYDVMCRNNSDTSGILDPLEFSNALQMLVALGDAEALTLMQQAQENNGAIEMTNEQGFAIIARANELRGEAAPYKPQEEDIVGALLALAEAGDPEAVALLAEAEQNSGEVELTDAIVHSLLERAAALQEDAPPPSEVPLPAEFPSMQEILEALETLLEENDELALRLFAEAQQNAGELAITPDEATELIERAAAVEAQYATE